MYKNIEKQKVLHMAEQVDYQDGQIISRTLVQNSKLSMTLFAFEKDEEISTHAAGGDAMVTVLEGTGRFTVGGEVFLVSQGETLIMPKDIPHAVYGQERFKMLLTVSFQKSGAKSNGFCTKGLSPLRASFLRQTAEIPHLQSERYFD